VGLPLQNLDPFLELAKGLSQLRIVVVKAGILSAELLVLSAKLRIVGAKLLNQPVTRIGVYAHAPRRRFQRRHL